MHAMLLVVGLAFGQTAEDKLLTKLDATVQKLLAGDPQAQEVRKAAELLRTTNSSDRWTNYADAIKILRQTRSKAGIPLLLAYMVRHSNHGSSHIYVPEYAQTLTILTGKDIPDPYQYVADRKTPVRQAVEKLVADWWEPEQDKIDTDLGQWPVEQLQVLASCLLARSSAAEGHFPPSVLGRPSARGLTQEWRIGRIGRAGGRCETDRRRASDLRDGSLSRR